MGRSVMTLAGYDAVAYDTFEPDESFYRSLWDDDLADGLVDEDDDFDTWMYDRWSDDSPGDWDDFVEGIAQQIADRWPSLEVAVDDNRWIGDELRVINESEHSIVTISEYNGVVAICLGANYDRQSYFRDPSQLSGIGAQWRKLISRNFEKLGTLRKLGTFSNGNSVYSQKGSAA